MHAVVKGVSEDLLASPSKKKTPPSAAQLSSDAAAAKSPPRVQFNTESEAEDHLPRNAGAASSKSSFGAASDASSAQVKGELSHLVASLAIAGERNADGDGTAEGIVNCGGGAGGAGVLSPP